MTERLHWTSVLALSIIGAAVAVAQQFIRGDRHHGASIPALGTIGRPSWSQPQR